MGRKVATIRRRNSEIGNHGRILRLSYEKPFSSKCFHLCVLRNGEFCPNDIETNTIFECFDGVVWCFLFGVL